MAVARSNGRAISLLIIDVDHFKLVNDTYGHLQGDDVLVEVAELIRLNLRGYDIAARYAGDEFVALLPNTALEGGREVAERICSALRGHAFKLRGRPGVVPVTASIGVATYPEHGEEYDTLFAAADRALYQVKRQGRDGVATAATVAEPTPLPLGIERFVGRADELRRLVRALETAADASPRIISVIGEAGVGKSTLVKQLAPEVRLRAGSYVVGRCQEGDVRPPYGPWAEALGAIRRLGAVPAREWRELPRLVPALLPDGASLADGSGSKYLLLEELAEFLRVASAERPLVLVLDDMQWADSASWDALEYVAPQLDRERLLICLTMRAEELHGEALERRRRISRGDRFEQLELARLTREELKQWVDAAFRRQDMGHEFLDFLHGHTEGNALFVVQVLRTLVDEGAIRWEGDQWEFRLTDSLKLPVAVSDLILRRIGRLSEKSQAILATAAVIGRQFDLDLAIDAGAGSEDELLDAVDEAVRAAVLQPVEERAGDRYAFTHGKLAEVLRSATNPRRLKRMHERVAGALERRHPDAVAEIATHYDLAGHAGQAYHFALMAARRATTVYAHQQALDFLRMAERHTSSLGQLAEVRVRLAETLETLGRYEESAELCGMAIEWFASERDAPRALTLRRMGERLRSLLGQPASVTLAACQALEAEALSLSLDSERAQLLLMISQASGRMGDRPLAERIARECVEIAERLGDPTLLADALNRLAITLELDQPVQAVQYFNRALRLYRGREDFRGQARCHNNLGVVHTIRGEWEEARHSLTTAVALGRSAGMPDMWGLGALNLGVLHMKCGEYDRARDLFGEALALFGTLKNRERHLAALYNLAHLDRERGANDSAAELYDAACAAARAMGQAEIEIGALAGAGLTRLAQARSDVARRLAREVSSRLADRPEWFQGRELAEALAIRLAAADGALSDAVARLDDALERASTFDPYGAVWLAAACADAMLRHDPERARRTVSEYAERSRTLGYTGMVQRYGELLARM